MAKNGAMRAQRQSDEAEQKEAIASKVQEAAHPPPMTPNPFAPPVSPPAPERIGQLDLAAIQIANAQAGEAVARAKTAKLAVMVRYKLGPDDTFDVGTGVITRAPA